MFLGQRRPWVKGHGCHCYVHCTLKQDLTSYSFFIPFLCLVRLFYWWNRSQRNPKWIHKRASRSNQKTLSFGGAFPCPGVDQEESVSVNLCLWPRTSGEGSFPRAPDIMNFSGMRWRCPVPYLKGAPATLGCRFLWTTTRLGWSVSSPPAIDSCVLPCTRFTRGGVQGAEPGFHIPGRARIQHSGLKPQRFHLLS